VQEESGSFPRKGGARPSETKKRLIMSADASGLSRDSRIKVFGFFSSEKKSLPP
jgi:hypothetical protein